MQLFCIFIGQQEIGIPIEHVIETSTLDTYTVLPGTPKFIVGLVNLRGEIIPVFNLSRLMGASIDYSINKTVYLSLDGITFGVLLSKLSSTIKINPLEIDPYPASISGEVRSLFSGIIHYPDRNIQILDIAKLIYFIKKQEF